MIKVVKNEILKLFNIMIIDSIFNSKLMSYGLVVPKRLGTTIVKNEENKLVPTRV